MAFHDQSVTHLDWFFVKRKIRHEGYLPLALWVFDHEPELALVVSSRVNRIKRMLQNCNLKEEQFAAVMRQINMLAVEPLAVLHRAQRRLWEQFLPEDGEVTPAGTEGESHG